MMKSDSHSLIYIVISIILLIISTIGKNKNKKQAGSAPSQEEAPRPVSTWQEELEEVFTSIGGEISPQNKNYPPAFPEVTPTEPAKLKVLEEVPDANATATVSPKTMPVETLNHQLSFQNQPVNEVSDEIIHLDENEIKKAFIYSEIFNRKYC